MRSRVHARAAAPPHAHAHANANHSAAPPHEHAHAHANHSSHSSAQTQPASYEAYVHKQQSKLDGANAHMLKYIHLFDNGAAGLIKQERWAGPATASLPK